MWCRIREMHVACMCPITSAGRGMKQCGQCGVRVITHNRQPASYSICIMPECICAQIEAITRFWFCCQSPWLGWSSQILGIWATQIVAHLSCNYARRGLPVQRLEAPRSQWAARTGRWSPGSVCVGLSRKQVEFNRSHASRKWNVYKACCTSPGLGTRVQSLEINVASVVLLFVTHSKKLHGVRLTAPPPHPHLH